MEDLNSRNVLVAGILGILGNFLIIPTDKNIQITAFICWLITNSILFNKFRKKETLGLAIMYFAYIVFSIMGILIRII